jgi:hypothetical protein
MKKFISVLTILSFLLLPLVSVSAISPQEIQSILQKKKDPYLQSILKAHKRAMAKRQKTTTTEIKGGLWRSTLNVRESSLRNRPSYTSDSFRMTEVRTPEMLEKPDRRRTGITRRVTNQPRLWSRTSTQNKERRIRQFSRGGNAWKQNLGKEKTSVTEQKKRYLKRKLHQYNPFDSE